MITSCLDLRFSRRVIKRKGSLRILPIGEGKRAKGAAAERLGSCVVWSLVLRGYFFIDGNSCSGLAHERPFFFFERTVPRCPRCPELFSLVKAGMVWGSDMSSLSFLIDGIGWFSFIRNRIQI
jgi:hypothetical protein